MSNDYNSLFLSNNAGTGPSVPTAAGEGVSRYVNRNGVERFENDTYQSHEESIQADAKRRGGFDFQVTSPDGRVVSPGRGVKETDLIKIPMGNGQYCETTVGNAVRQGIMSRNEQGSYVFDEAEVARDLTPREAEPKQPAGEFMQDRAAENLVNILARDVQPADAVGVINDLIEDGAVNPNLLGNVASQLQVSPQEAAGYIDRMTAGFTTQAASAAERITGGAFSADDVWAWARENDPAGLKQAMRAQVTERSTAGYKSLAKAFMGKLDSHQPQVVFDAATAAGLNPTWDSQRKQVILHLPDGRSLPYRQAVELGIISLTGKVCVGPALTFGGLALNAITQLTGYAGRRQQANQQAAANAAAEQSARLAFENNSNSEALRIQQEAEAVSQTVMARNTDLATKMATARVSAGESNVSGLSIDAYMHDLIRQGDVANTATKRQAELDALQATMRNKGYLAEYQGRVNGQPLVNRPSFASLALGVTTGAVGILANSSKTDPKTGKVTIPGLDF